MLICMSLFENYLASFASAELLDIYDTNLDEPFDMYSQHEI